MFKLIIHLIRGLRKRPCAVYHLYPHPEGAVGAHNYPCKYHYWKETRYSRGPAETYIVHKDDPPTGAIQTTYCDIHTKILPKRLADKFSIDSAAKDVYHPMAGPALTADW